MSTDETVPRSDPSFREGLLLQSGALAVLLRRAALSDPGLFADLLRTLFLCDLRTGPYAREVSPDILRDLAEDLSDSQVENLLRMALLSTPRSRPTLKEVLSVVGYGTAGRLVWAHRNSVLRILRSRPRSQGRDHR